MVDEPITEHAAHTAHGVASLTKRKVFGVPVMVFILIAAAVLLYFAFTLRKTNEPEDTTTPPDETPAGDDTGATPIFRALPHDDGGDGGSGGDTDPIRTDRQWADECITWLIGQGENATKATAAIHHYIYRLPVSAEERILVDKCLVEFGPPPHGYQDPGPGGGGGNGGGRQGNPPLHHTVRGTHDNNPTELTRIYYNRTDDETKRYLLANNTNLDPPYPVGTHVFVPMYKSPKYFTATATKNTAAKIAAANGTNKAHIIALNPGMHFPVAPGTRVRVQ